MIYFVQAASGPIKIGFTGDWKKRRVALQLANFERLTALLVIAGTLEEERALHRTLAVHRIRGEWFRPAPEVMACIDGHRADAVAIPRGKTARKGLAAVKPRARMSLLEIIAVDGDEAVAAKIGVSPGSIRHIRTGERAISDRVLERAFAAYGKRLDVAATLLSLRATTSPAVDHTTSSAPA